MNIDRFEYVRAIRGPVLLITLGVLMVLEYFQDVSFSRTWPVLLIVFGIMKLWERSMTVPGGPAI